MRINKMLPMPISNRLKALCVAKGWKVFQRLPIYGELLPLVLIGNGTVVITIDAPQDERHWFIWLKNFRNAERDIKKTCKYLFDQDNAEVAQLAERYDMPLINAFEMVNVVPVVLLFKDRLPDFDRIHSWAGGEKIRILNAYRRYGASGCQTFEAFIDEMGEQKEMDEAELDRIATAIVNILDENA